MERLLAHCVEGFSSDKGIYLTFLIAGLTGGFTHCLSMCGPYAACETACKAAKNCSKVDQLSNAFSLPYHVGRMLTYGGLGFAASFFSRQIAYGNKWWPDFASAMLFGAGIMFLLSFYHSFSGGHKHHGSGQTYFRGMLLGFMPCGLIYAALMMAATIQNPLNAMLAMWLFVIGTIPALSIASGSVQILSQKWQEQITKVGRALMAFNGISLLIMASRIMR